jgi:transposase
VSFSSLEDFPMAARSRQSQSRRSSDDLLQKPRGSIHARVQQVGPEHFGIVSVDCAKLRSKWMLADFYGKVIVPPTHVLHNRVELQAMIDHIRRACQEHELRDVIVAIERTGRYHHVIRDTFRRAQFETRIVHPFISKHFRQPADPDNKTDDRDLAAIHRATTNGFALIEPPLDTMWQTLRLLARHRRDLVDKTSHLACQIREHLDAAWPGYGALFSDLWESKLVFPLFRHYASPQALLEAGSIGICTWLRQQKIQFRLPTIQTILTWAGQAAPGEATAQVHHRLALAAVDDYQRKTQEILELERELAGFLSQTPYVLLLSIPGINVVWAAEFAGEMGPIEHYPNARTITGRAGLFPCRYQSDQVDHPNGRLARRANRRLRAVLLGIADTLIGCNHHFSVLAERWRRLGKDARHSHVKIALRFARIAFSMVASRQVFHHPCMRERHTILDKLLAFHREHRTPWEQTLADLHRTVRHVPRKEYAAEAKPLAEQLHDFNRRRPGPKGPQLLGDILATVLARLGVGAVQSKEPGDSTPT